MSFSSSLLFSRSDRQFASYFKSRVLFILPLAVALFFIEQRLTASDNYIGNINTELFERNYAFLGIQNSYPVQKTNEHFTVTRALLEAGFGYMHFYEWLIRIDIGFRQLQNRDSLLPVNLMYINQKINYLYRVHHPFYLSLGYGLSYLYPAQEITFPLRRNTEYEAEVGVQANLMFLYHISPKWVVLTEYERWRGTKTTKWQGYSWLLKLGFGFH